MAAQPEKITRPGRWNNPFDADFTEEGVAEVLGLSLFEGVKPEAFPKHLPLEGLIKNDMRIIRVQRGDFLVREGDYGDSAFLILDGSVNVVLPPGLPKQILGQSAPRKRNWLTATKQYLRKFKYDEVRLAQGRYITSDTAVRRQAGQPRVYLKDVEAVKAAHSIVPLNTGELFGEVAALARTQRNTTVFAEEDTRLLEIRWQGLRDLRRYVVEFREYVNGIYRERNLVTHLKSIELFYHLDDSQLEQVAREALFESYGFFDWHTRFNRSKSDQNSDPGTDQIAEQGGYPDGLLLIRSGFALISQKMNHGQKTTSVASQGDMFGLEELLYNHEHETPIPYQNELSTLGYSDVLRIPTSTIETLILPYLSTRTKQQLRVNLDRFRQKHLLTAPSDYADFMEFSVENRYFNGTATMMIDIDRCTQCDECVHACANSHSGNPRFNRHGKKHQNHMVANACMHCVDPVCMIGCPTGAIHRSETLGEVVISDESCIGCETCANSCPYDNIRMVEVRDSRGRILLDDNSQTAIMKATKCDLCFDLPGGPACERACPHDALKRVDMRDSDALNARLNR